MTPPLEVLIPTVSIVLAILASHVFLRRNMRRDIAGIHRDIAGLRERMARVEGFLEALVPAASSPAPNRARGRND